MARILARRGEQDTQRLAVDRLALDQTRLLDPVEQRHHVRAVDVEQAPDLARGDIGIGADQHEDRGIGHARLDGGQAACKIAHHGICRPAQRITRDVCKRIDQASSPETVPLPNRAAEPALVNPPSKGAKDC
jgi:hypothetical protein